MLRFSLLLVLTALIAAPAFAQSPRAQMNAQVAALCNGDTSCMAEVRQKLRDHCGPDRACMRDALQRAHEERDAQDPRLADLPEPLQDLVRALLDLGDQARAGNSSSEAPSRLADLPEPLQDRIRQRCGTDPDCIRESVSRARERRQQGESTNPEPTEDPTEDPAETDESEDGSGSSRVRPFEGRVLPDGPGRSTPPLETPQDDAGEDEAPRRRGMPERLPDEATDRDLPTLDIPDSSAEERTRPPIERQVPGHTPQVGSVSPPTVSSPGTDASEDGPIVHGTGRTTWVSGTKDDRVRNIWAPDNGWLIGIRMSEKSDDPCDLDAYFATEDFVTSRRLSGNQVDGDGSSEGLAKYFSECQDGGGNATSAHLLAFNRTTNMITLDYPYALKENEDGDEVPYAINGLQVCQRQSNDLLKGLRIFGVHLDLGETPVEADPILKEVAYQPSPSEAANGAVPGVVEVPADLEFERPNCNDWDTERVCPAGQVGVGLEIHYNTTSSGRAQITGLALHCAELTR